MVNDYLVADLKKLGLWNAEMLAEIKQNEGSVQNIASIPEYIKAKYKETFEIDGKVFINLAAFRGKWIDQSQSLNLFYKGTSGKEIADMYMYAYDMGLKTTYYLRTLGASAIEKATTSIKASHTAPVQTGNQVSSFSTTVSANSTIPSPVVNVAEQPIPFPSSGVAQSAVPTIDAYTAISPTSDLVSALKIKEKSFAEPTPSIINVKTYSEINHALNTIKENTEKMAVTVPAKQQTFKVGGKEFKIHKVLDPECEACQ
jgi:ribonucleotide reductase alpha subunit